MFSLVVMLDIFKWIFGTITIALFVTVLFKRVTVYNIPIIVLISSKGPIRAKAFVITIIVLMLEIFILDVFDFSKYSSTNIYFIIYKFVDILAFVSFIYFVSFQLYVLIFIMKMLDDSKATKYVHDILDGNDILKYVDDTNVKYISLSEFMKNIKKDNEQYNKISPEKYLHENEISLKNIFLLFIFDEINRENNMMKIDIIYTNTLNISIKDIEGFLKICDQIGISENQVLDFLISNLLLIRRSNYDITFNYIFESKNNYYIHKFMSKLTLISGKESRLLSINLILDYTKRTGNNVILMILFQNINNYYRDCNIYYMVNGSRKTDYLFEGSEFIKIDSILQVDEQKRYSDGLVKIPEETKFFSVDINKIDSLSSEDNIILQTMGIDDLLRPLFEANNTYQTNIISEDVLLKITDILVENMNELRNNTDKGVFYHLYLMDNIHNNRKYLIEDRTKIGRNNESFDYLFWEQNSEIFLERNEKLLNIIKNIKFLTDDKKNEILIGYNNSLHDKKKYLNDILSTNSTIINELNNVINSNYDFANELLSYIEMNGVFIPISNIEVWNLIYNISDSLNTQRKWKYTNSLYLFFISLIEDDNFSEINISMADLTMNATIKVGKTNKQNSICSHLNELNEAYSEYLKKNQKDKNFQNEKIFDSYYVTSLYNKKIDFYNNSKISFIPERNVIKYSIFNSFKIRRCIDKCYLNKSN